MEKINKDNLIIEHILNIRKSLNDINASLQNIYILFKEKVEKSENSKVKDKIYEFEGDYKEIRK